MITLAEIRAAFPDLTPYTRDDAAIAATLSVGRTRLVSRMIGIGTVLDTLGPEAGAAALDTLDALRATNRPLAWAWVLLERGDLDIGMASTRAQLQALATAGVLQQAQADALLSLAVVADPVSPSEVSAVLYGVM